MTKEDQKFRIMKNGYDRYAVDHVLDEYLEQIELLKKQLMVANSQMGNMRQQLDELHLRHQVLVSELTIKEKAAEDISRLALKEANAIIETAQNNANLIVREALSNARLILVDLAKISTETAGMKKEMKQQLNVILKTIDEFEIPPAPNMDWLKQKK